MNHSLFKLLAAVICAIALFFGLVRIWVGLALMTQAAGVFEFAAFNEPIKDIRQFLLEMNDQALVPLTTVAYLSIIAFMGYCLVFGAVGSWYRQKWGYGLLATYLFTHAALFVNFQTINPKINILIAGIIMLLILLFANQHRRI